MTAVAYGMLADHQLAEDAAQEGFARALVSLRRLKTPEKFAPWLAQICRHVAADMRRARCRMAVVRDCPPAEDEPDGEIPAGAVRRAIDELPKALREVLLLRYYDDRSYEQISAVLGLSKGAINGRLTRAKRRLARTLRRRGVLENGP